MTIPNLPTDNIYKFIALTGVFILIFSMFYPRYLSNIQRDEITIFNGEKKKLDFETDILKNKQKDLINEITELNRKLKVNFPAIVNDSLIVSNRVTEGPKELVERSNVVKDLIENYKESSFQYSLKVLETETKSVQINDKESDLHELNQISDFLIFFSIFLTLIGFMLWYNNTQKYQDKVLKEQANQFLKNTRCQSCGMKLSDQNHYFLFSEEERKSIYCKTCFDGSGFIEPNLTLKEMQEKVRIRLKELKIPKLLASIFIKKLKDLDRWKVKYKL